MSVADAAQAPDEAAAAKKRRRKRITRIIQGSISFVVVVAIFGLVIPQIANYSDVWKIFTQLTWLELTGLVLATIFNLITYWLQMMAAMPGLTWGQAAVNNQTTTTIANILPGGGAIAVGLAVAIFRSWGFSASAITLEITLTGIWNSFLKLGLPIIALVCVAVTGGASAALITPAIVGLIILAGCVAAFALMLWRKRFARGLGSSIGRFWSWLKGLFHKPPVTDWGDRAVRFRHDTIELLGRRWIPLTLTTIVSHLALYLVLLLALRDVGVSGQEISWAQILAVFAFGRLITALPITPGGLGLVEAAYIAAFIAIGKSHADVPLPEFKAQIAAAVLLFRTLTFGIQIPLGGFTYIIWRAKKSWRRPPPDPEPTAGPTAEAIGAQPVPG
jgi:putative heme transporter